MFLHYCIFILFLANFANSEPYEGDCCNLTNGSPGLCAYLKKCTSVFNEFQAGNAPDKLCGYIGFHPVVCCPTSTPATSGPTRPGTYPVNRGDGRGEIARQKCAEYSRFVYSLKTPPTLLPGSKPINTSDCAIKSQKSTAGGTNVERMEFPHMAAIGFISEDGSVTWLYSGSVISEKFVLTAAHCTEAIDFGAAAWVRVGDLNLDRSDDGAKPVNIRVTERIRHPEYNSRTQYHDIALLRLETVIKFNGWVRPACLHTEPTTGTSKALATGWGRLDSNDPESSNELAKALQYLTDSQTCNASWTASGESTKMPNGVVGEWSICAGGRSARCQGDSGGPLVIYSSREYCMYEIIGVTSFRKMCGSDLPGVYARVYHYVPWIESVVWGRD